MCPGPNTVLLPFSLSNCIEEMIKINSLKVIYNILGVLGKIQQLNVDAVFFSQTVTAFVSYEVYFNKKEMHILFHFYDVLYPVNVLVNTFSLK